MTDVTQRVIGLLGGMSWESTAHYYPLANELLRDRLGGLHSARNGMRYHLVRVYQPVLRLSGVARALRLESSELHQQASHRGDRRITDQRALLKINYARHQLTVRFESLVPRQ